MNLTALNMRLFKLGLVSKLHLNKELRNIGLYSGQMRTGAIRGPVCTPEELASGPVYVHLVRQMAGAAGLGFCGGGRPRHPGDR